MSEPWKGGKGKKAPYETTHHRIPAPIRTAVKMFSDEYKRLIDAGADGENLIKRVEDAVAAGIREQLDLPVTKFSNMDKDGNGYQQLEDKLDRCQRNAQALEAQNKQLLVSQANSDAAINELRSQIVDLESRLEKARDYYRQQEQLKAESVLIPKAVLGKWQLEGAGKEDKKRFTRWDKFHDFLKEIMKSVKE